VVWPEGVPRLSGRGVLVREVLTSDAPSLFACLSDPQVTQHVSPPPPSIAAFEKFIAWAHGERAAGRSICFGIVPEGVKAAVGVIQVRAMTPDWFTAEWGFILGAAFWSTGVFVKAANLVAEFAFTRLKVNRLEARSVDSNARGHAAIQKLGAQPEATLSRAFRRDDQADRQILWTLTEASWRDQSIMPDRVSSGEARARVASAIRDSQEKKTPRTILVVDDQVDAREMIAEFLSLSGFTVRQAEDGFQAIEAASRYRPGVILMDLMMPRMDGWEATRRLKADARTADIPIAAVSACMHEQDQQLAREVGCEVAFPKPVDLDQLAVYVEVALARQPHHP